MGVWLKCSDNVKEGDSPVFSMNLYKLVEKVKNTNLEEFNCIAVYTHSEKKTKLENYFGDYDAEKRYDTIQKCRLC